MSEIKAEVSVTSFMVFEYQWKCPVCFRPQIKNDDIATAKYIRCSGCHQVLYREAPGLYSSKKQEG